MKKYWLSIVFICLLVVAICLSALLAIGWNNHLYKAQQNKQFPVVLQKLNPIAKNYLISAYGGDDGSWQKAIDNVKEENLRQVIITEATLHLFSDALPARSISGAFESLRALLLLKPSVSEGIKNEALNLGSSLADWCGKRQDDYYSPLGADFLVFAADYAGVEEKKAFLSRACEIYQETAMRIEKKSPKEAAQ